MDPNLHERAQEITAAAIKAAPPIAVAGASGLGVDVHALVMWATLIYVVLQIVVLCLKEWRAWRARQRIRELA